MFREKRSDFERKDGEGILRNEYQAKTGKN